MLHSSRTTTTPGPDVRIACRACGRADVRARTFLLEERIALYLIVPLPTQRERHVVCAACGTDRLTALAFDELAALGPDEAAEYLYPRVSVVAKLFGVTSVLLCLCPFVGLVLGVIAMGMTYRTRGWVFRAGLIGAAVNVLLWTALTAWELVAGKRAG